MWHGAAIGTLRIQKKKKRSNCFIKVLQERFQYRNFNEVWDVNGILKRFRIEIEQRKGIGSKWDFVQKDFILRGCLVSSLKCDSRECNSRELKFRESDFVMFGIFGKC